MHEVSLLALIIDTQKGNHQSKCWSKIAKGHRLYANPFNHKNILDFSFRQKNVHFIKFIRYFIPISRYQIQMRHMVTTGNVRYVKTKGSGYASQEKNIA